MNLGIKYFFNNPIFISLVANKVLIGAKINTHKLILKLQASHQT